MLNPISTSREIHDSYVRYLKTTFPIADDDLRKQFEAILSEKDKFVRGPILESTPLFKAGASPAQLIEEGLLSSKLKQLDGSSFPVNRPLYCHQETAIRKICGQGRNLVIATGTGSGKTECFLIPILNHLFRQKEQGQLTPGVRALLLYPMNALANDQLKRLRRLLINCPEITFGRYTGETQDATRSAKEYFRKNFPEEPELPNELQSREEMRKSPPHILLTNYAMLEYLLLRPADSELFDGRASGNWTFIVMDEAHTYDGAKGIEVAMLLRRLKDRVTRGKVSDLRCIATSATVGGGIQNMPGVAKFASRLFSERFSWNTEDSAEQDVVIGTRTDVCLAHEWGKPDSALYPALVNVLESQSGTHDEMISILSRHKVPNEVIQAAASAEHLEDAVYRILQGDAVFHELRSKLDNGCQSLQTLASQIMPELSEAQAAENLTALVELAGKAKSANDDAPLLSARYHLFLRALDGAYASFNGGKELFLDRRVNNEHNGNKCAVFEIGTCRRCGSIYLIGKTHQDDFGDFFVQHASREEDNQTDTEFLLLHTVEDDAESDEDELVAANEDIIDTVNRSSICTTCGAIAAAQGGHASCSCPTDLANWISVTNVPSKDGRITCCYKCGMRGPNIVFRVLTGQDAPASVIATSLYQSLPEPVQTKNELTTNDDWLPVADKTKQPGRQLLLFSDSRQDAAFFACYLNRTYSQILRRRLIVFTLEKYHKDAIENKWRLQDLVEPLRREATMLGLFNSTDTQQEQISLVWKWLLLEFMAFDRRNSLEGLGLLGFALTKPQGWKAPTPLKSPPWSLSEDQVWALYQVILGTLRSHRALSFPEHVDPRDPEFAPRNRQLYFRKTGSEPAAGILSWSTSRKGSLNRRKDFLQRLARRVGYDALTTEDFDDMLAKIWDKTLLERNAPLSSYLEQCNIKNEGVVFQLKHLFWDLVVGEYETTWYFCDSCSSLTLNNVKGVCPTFRCQGQLIQKSPSELYADNHYRYMYKTLRLLPMKAEEHTAQLEHSAASELQDKFLRGEVNVLSCSTTFELGVDVGELQSVFLRNVPPSTANYVQRAGRAGRRKESTAFVVTFAQRRSHDFAYFQRPENLVAGVIKPPHFELRNEKIIRRHVHATALSSFWRQCPDFYGTVDSFFFAQPEKGPDKLQLFLRARPQALQLQLKRIVPQDLSDRLDLNGWGWVDALFDGSEGPMKLADDDIHSDVLALEELRQRLIDDRKNSDWVLNMINTVRSRHILDTLSSHNVVPKYGFPVDVVNLQLLHHSPDAKRLTLERDLRIALSEYAPGSQVVAGGKLWKSTRIKKVPNREWLTYEYSICDKCKRYQRTIAGTTPLTNCGACDEIISLTNSFLVPQFGFVSDEMPDSPGDTRPERTYSTSVVFSGEKAKDELKRVLSLKNVSLQASAASEGRLAVINRAGFRICHSCGYATLSSGARTNHKAGSGKECNGKLRYSHLGYEFKTDVLDLRFVGYSPGGYFVWQSLLYALLEGAAETLSVTRDDLDGCLYAYSKNPHEQAMILFDDVPGGAGHVRRLVEEPGFLEQLLANARRCVSGTCGCDSETSCYGCLRNYSNQPHHASLKRGPVYDFLCNAGIPQIISKTSSEKFETDIWQTALDFANPSVVALLKSARQNGWDPPQVGCDITGNDGRVIAELELAWKSKGLAVVLQPLTPMSLKKLTELGWRCVTPAEAAKILDDKVSGGIELCPEAKQ